ncbi:MAG: carbonate dehydratase [Gammaproteobacteria bacterium]|nr:carbonate dehydratase [Gammaproteobacteria bacterium]
MIRRNPRGDLPVVHDSAYVDPMAILCGRVVVHADVFIAPYAVIRADEVDANGDMKAIVIGAQSNIQDGVVMHAKSGAAVTIGERTSIAHRAIVHGPCSVGDGAFIGFNSVLFDCAVGEGCVVGHGAVVEGCDLPAGFHVPATQCIGAHTGIGNLERVTAEHSRFSEDVVRTNNALVHGYRRLAGLRSIESPAGPDDPELPD